MVLFFLFFLSLQSRIAQVYSESIEKLRGVLTAMQNMSQKREGLEKKLRSQLEGEIRRLKKNLPVRNKEDGDLTEALTNLQIEKTSLAADCVKVREVQTIVNSGVS